MAAFSTIATVALIAGAGLAAASSIQQGKASNAAARFNAQVAEQQAAREREVARLEAQNFRRTQGRLLAASRARRAGQGVTMEGTPLLVDESTAAEIELGALTIERGGQARATRLEQEAGLERFRGRSAERAGFMRAGSTLLTGAGTAFSFGGSGGRAPTGGSRFTAPPNRINVPFT